MAFNDINASANTKAFNWAETLNDDIHK